MGLCCPATCTLRTHSLDMLAHGDHTICDRTANARRVKTARPDADIVHVTCMLSWLYQEKATPPPLKRKRKCNPPSDASAFKHHTSRCSCVRRGWEGAPVGAGGRGGQACYYVLPSTTTHLTVSEVSGATGVDRSPGSSFTTKTWTRVVGGRDGDGGGGGWPSRQLVVRSLIPRLCSYAWKAHGATVWIGVMVRRLRGHAAGAGYRSALARWPALVCRTPHPLTASAPASFAFHTLSRKKHGVRPGWSPAGGARRQAGRTTPAWACMRCPCTLRAPPPRCGHRGGGGLLHRTAKGSAILAHAQAAGTQRMPRARS